ncbi:TetR/AcrR family transcriptional regulator [Nocardiopsis sp. MT53]|uniref:TetR family transcriptional regulator n=2 Tax=Nocardiopsidaceae TaxID=83676 RepID=A0ABX8BVU3_9ACTN|nr:TetR family transcriptional regulator [Nocardiopsis changdeensis]QYX40518.1 TetR/AcrR family transcriptional regulator [Nocardiopsis sp. MT53]
MTDDPRDLRTRRRLATHREIHEAALDLFEEQGVRETTVQQIAERAGVSQRTFFRHFETKEQAGLPGHHRLARMVEELEPPAGDPAGTLRHIERATALALAADDPELREHRRVALLFAREPELLVLAAAREKALITRLRERLSAPPADLDPTAALLVAEIAVAVWRTTWERWGERTAAGEEVDPVDLYRECSDRLRALFP